MSEVNQQNESSQITGGNPKEIPVMNKQQQAKQPQTINTKPETTNMETHAHQWHCYP